MLPIGSVGLGMARHNRDVRQSYPPPRADTTPTTGERTPWACTAPAEASGYLVSMRLSRRTTPNDSVHDEVLLPQQPALLGHNRSVIPIAIEDTVTWLFGRQDDASTLLRFPDVTCFFSFKRFGQQGLPAVRRQGNGLAL